MSIAFKEWAVICDALGSGRQSIIIRKGGIAEGRAGFAFRHDEFFLFPTWFHEQLEKTTLPAETSVPPEPGEEFDVRFAATVEWSGLLTDWEKVSRLRNLHVWQEDVVQERFRYEGDDGVHVAFVRIFRLDPPVKLKMDKKYGGCRSWVELPELEGVALVSVLSDEEHQRRRKLLDELLGQGDSPGL